MLENVEHASNLWLKLDFTFKVFLRYCILQIKLFAIKNLLLRMILGIDLDSIPLFQIQKSLKPLAMLFKCSIEFFSYLCYYYCNHCFCNGFRTNDCEIYFVLLLFCNKLPKKINVFSQDFCSYFFIFKCFNLSQD